MQIVTHIKSRFHFNPRTPCGVRLRAIAADKFMPTISIHAPLAGCDENLLCNCENTGNFNPRTPCGVRPSISSGKTGIPSFQSTHPLRGATKSEDDTEDFRQISIHAPLAGCDEAERVPCCDHADFNPRTPCGVRRIFRMRSLRRSKDFNPRTPCGVRPNTEMGGRRLYNFNPRTPCGVRLIGNGEGSSLRSISIHAPLAGCDLSAARLAGYSAHFNPRTPCGVRLTYGLFCGLEINFNPRTPCGVRLGLRRLKPTEVDISIHAPLAGCDRSSSRYHARRRHFNPRTPCGVRPLQRQAW